MTEHQERRPESEPQEGRVDCCDVAHSPQLVPTTPFGRFRRATWRVLIAIAGSVVILVGALLSVPGIPGPGVVVMLAGLAILATEFAFARRLLHRLRDKAKEGVSGVRGWWRRFRGKPEPPGNNGCSQ
jgi:hypothetical protein